MVVVVVVGILYLGSGILVVKEGEIKIIMIEGIVIFFGRFVIVY